MVKITKEILNKIYPSRPEECHKYDFGLMLVIGGSRFYSGSPALSGMAGFRSGVDMVYVLAPKRAADIIASFSPNLAASPLEGDYLTKKHLPRLLEATQSAKAVAHGNTAVVIGGGMGRSKETRQVILKYLSQISVPAVIDADAIYAVSQKPEVISGKKFLITPHSHEFYILTGKKVPPSLEEREELVRKEAQRLETTILLKGREDVISDGEEVAHHLTGSPYLSVGGTGDTLAGVAGSLLARGTDLFLAAQGASLINREAGRRAADRKKEGIVATDLVESIPHILKEFLES